MFNSRKRSVGPLAALVAATLLTTCYARANAQNRRPATKPLPVTPFVEDERTPAAQPSARPTVQAPAKKPATPPKPKSNFQPRFRTPVIHQAQHTEPVVNGTPTTAAAKPMPAQANEPQALPAGTAELKPLDAGGIPVVKITTLPEDAIDVVEPLNDEPLNVGLLDVDADGVEPVGVVPGDGRAAIDVAFAKSKAAETDADYTAVIDLCRRAIDAGLEPDYAAYSRQLMSWAYNRRGEARAAAGRDTEALADFEAAVELNPGSWRPVHNRAVSYAAAGRIDDALADFDRAIHLNPQYPNAYFNRGELRYGRGDFAGSIEDYSAALKVGPPDAVAYNSRGHAYYRLEKFGDALRDYGEAIKIDPEYSAALINRGDAYADLGRYGEAAKDYRAAVRVAPDMARAYQCAAWLMATCPDVHYRNETLAIEAGQKAVELDDKDFRSWETLAAAQASAGQFDAAKKSQEQAIALAPRGSKLNAEKRMALYQRETAFRDSPRVAAAAMPMEMNEYPVKQASGTSPIGPAQQGRPMQPQGRFAPPAQAARPPVQHAPPRGLFAPKQPQQHYAPRPSYPPPQPRMPGNNAPMSHPFGRN